MTEAMPSTANSHPIRRSFITIACISGSYLIAALRVTKQVLKGVPGNSFISDASIATYSA